MADCESSKECRDCREGKPLSEFSKNSAKPDGLMLYCKPCMSVRYKKHYDTKVVAPESRPPSKICSRCGVEKPAEQFTPVKGRKSGLKSYCKECSNAQLRDRYRADPESEKLRHKEDYDRNREARLETGRAYKVANKETLREKRKVYLEANKDAVSESFKAWYAKNRESQIAKAMKWHYDNFERSIQNIKANNAVRKSRKRASGGKMTSREWREILNYFNYCCAYCLRHSDEVGRLELDHMMPVSRGGTADASNMVPACRSCNSSKLNRTPMEFLSYKCKYRKPKPQLLCA